MDAHELGQLEMVIERGQQTFRVIGVMNVQTTDVHQYRFSPRLADLGDARLWRLDRGADYGVLNGLARNRIDRELIARSWDELLRLAGSLKMSTVGAVELLHSLQGGGRVSTLGRALTELGRGPKTLHLLSYFDDEGHRRYIGRHLTRHESRHKLARTVFHGRKGQLRQPYRKAWRINSARWVWSST